jgi:hypothetical protein
MSRNLQGNPSQIQKPGYARDAIAEHNNIKTRQKAIFSSQPQKVLASLAMLMMPSVKSKSVLQGRRFCCQ